MGNWGTERLAYPGQCDKYACLRVAVRFPLAFRVSDAHFRRRSLSICL